jgi:hypothetical protein
MPGRSRPSKRNGSPHSARAATRRPELRGDTPASHDPGCQAQCIEIPALPERGGLSRSRPTRSAVACGPERKQAVKACFRRTPGAFRPVAGTPAGWAAAGRPMSERRLAGYTRAPSGRLRRHPRTLLDLGEDLVRASLSTDGVVRLRVDVKGLAIGGEADLVRQVAGELARLDAPAAGRPSDPVSTLFMGRIRDHPAGNGSPTRPLSPETSKNPPLEGFQTRPAGFEPATFRSGGGRSIP